jgi:low affinity Fe/Cu permease
VTHTEFYFAIRNYILIAMLIILAIAVIAFIGATIISKIKGRFDDYMLKKIDEEFEGEDK